MITVNRIEFQEHEIYDPQGDFLGFLNELEFNDLRVQIIKEAAEGYYAVFQNEKIFIDKFGTPNVWPNGFYDQTLKSNMDIVSAQSQRSVKELEDKLRKEQNDNIE